MDWNIFPFDGDVLVEPQDATNGENKVRFSQKNLQYN